MSPQVKGGVPGGGWTGEEGTSGSRGRYAPGPMTLESVGPLMETPRLRLRPCREEDKPAFVSLLNTPGMMAELGGVTTRAAIEALVDRRISDQSRHGFSYWAVELRGTGELVGTCGIRIANNFPGTEVQGMHEAGWRIAEPWWGKGLAREAAEASLAWAWANTPAPRVGAWTTAGNARSWGLMERLGMRRRADLDFVYPAREGGQALPMIVYVLERPGDILAPLSASRHPRPP